MKNAILGLLAIFIGSCANDDVAAQKVKDCNCNKVVEVFTTNVVGYGNLPGATFYSYITINQCTGVQRSYSLSRQPVVVGDCR